MIAPFHHPGLQSENINVLNFPSSENVDFRSKDGVLKILPQIIKENILASTRSGPLMVYSDYSSDTILQPRMSCQASTSFKSTTDARPNAPSKVTQQYSNDSDVADLDEIMLFRNTSSESDEEQREAPLHFLSNSLSGLRPTIAFNQLNARSATSMPTIFEVDSVFSDDTPYYCLSKSHPETPVGESALIDVEEMCFKKVKHADSIEVVVVDISVLGGKKLGVLLMHP